MAAKEQKVLSASLEDYLEAILNLGAGGKVVHSKAIAEVLGVAKPSVTGALRLLAKRGLVNYRPYDSITLTETGKAQAAAVAKKHDILKSFFMDILGVDERKAQDAACKAEHTFNPAVVARIADFTKFAQSGDPKLTSALKVFSKTKTGSKNRTKHRVK